jgi:hypothetical protein
MRLHARKRCEAHDPRTPYGDPRRSEHRAIRVGHILRPEYSRKLIRMITRVFR